SAKIVEAPPLLSHKDRTNRHRDPFPVAIVDLASYARRPQFMTGKVPCLMVNRLALLLKGAPSVSRDARSSQLRTLLTITHALFLSKEMWVHNLLAFLAARAAVVGALLPLGAALF